MHGEKQDKYEDLHAPGTARPQKVLPQKLKLALGDFVFYVDGENTFAGLVVKFLNGGLRVQLHDVGPNKQGDIKDMLDAFWLPQYYDKKMKVVGKKKTPARLQPSLTTVLKHQICLRGNLIDARHLDANARQSLLARL